MLSYVFSILHHISNIYLGVFKPIICKSSLVKGMLVFQNIIVFVLTTDTFKTNRNAVGSGCTISIYW